MKVLLIKMSSMGDIIHTMPALTDAGHHLPHIRFDWLIEEPFQALAHWHPLVKEVIPVALRRWRKTIFSRDTRLALHELKEKLQVTQYDIVLDAQGLLKSAVMARLARGVTVGLSFRSARERLAALFYKVKCEVNFEQNAILRMRQLFSQALGYPLPVTHPDFGFNFTVKAPPTQNPYLIFLFGTTWESKQWPISYWKKLASIASAAGLEVRLSAFNENEWQIAKAIQNNHPNIVILKNLMIADMAPWLLHAKAVISVDTGLGHLAAAMGTKTISLFGATNAEFTGTYGKKAVNVQANFPCSPCYHRHCHYRQTSLVFPACYGELTPEKVWQYVQT